MGIIRFQSRHDEATARVYLESRVATFTFMDTTEYCLTDFARDTEDEEIWLAVEQDTVIGFISIWKPENFIHHLFVSPKHLRRDGSWYGWSRGRCRSSITPIAASTTSY